MKIAIGNDHAAVELKFHLMDFLQKKGYEVVNFGTDTDASCDYPDYAVMVGNAVVSGECDKGVLVCGTGIGICIAANKLKGVRCATCADPVMARLTREHNDTNMVAIGARLVGPAMAEAIVETFLTTEFEGGERHMRRINKIMNIQDKQSVE